MTITLKPANEGAENAETGQDLSKTVTDEAKQADAAPVAAEPTENVPAEDGRIAVTVFLQPRHFEYLTERAATHGETPERHLETILRTFRAHHDQERPVGGASQRRG